MIKNMLQRIVSKLVFGTQPIITLEEKLEFMQSKGWRIQERWCIALMEGCYRRLRTAKGDELIQTRAELAILESVWSGQCFASRIGESVTDDEMNRLVRALSLLAEQKEKQYEELREFSESIAS